ncbi:hypothetical protein PV04_10855 [Phialophora macrospora]|uniref:EKC/KEOPS complex subunit BUD32 n=1 Tax=Phialophora macrospora TaxID=1851006 RepID=A0A0D2CCB4_9EURO|nr:hypothetical protein PV04_10855 [Phialophora macrospora]
MEKTMELGRAGMSTSLAMDTSRPMDLSRIVEMEHNEKRNTISSTGPAVKRTMELSAVMADMSQATGMSRPMDHKRIGNDDMTKLRTRDTATGPYKSIVMAPNRNMTTDRTMSLNEAASTSQNVNTSQASNRSQHTNQNLDRNRTVDMGPNTPIVVDPNIYPPLNSPTEMTRDSNTSMNKRTDHNSHRNFNGSGDKKATTNNYPSQVRKAITKNRPIAKKSINMTSNNMIRMIGNTNTSMNAYNTMSPSNAMSRNMNSYSTVESNPSTYNTIPSNMNAIINNTNNNTNVMKTNINSYHETPAHHPMCPYSTMSTKMNVSIKGQTTISTTVKLVEEQTILVIAPKRYYPVKIGDLYNQRYRVIAKLGYGETSTVWLARDEISKKHVSLKVCVQDESPGSPPINEVNMLQRLKSLAERDNHPGVVFTRLPLETFELYGPHGRYLCIVAEAEGRSLHELQKSFLLPRTLVRSLMLKLAYAVHWLHRTCGVIHTDISRQNVLIAVGEPTILQDVEDKERQDPTVPIVHNGLRIYKSRDPGFQPHGVPVLIDFGNMRMAGPANQTGLLSGDYRAPEALLKLPWGAPVDIWSLGVMTLELLEGRKLFDPVDGRGQYQLPIALAQYIAYLGPPPLAMIRQSPLFRIFFDQNGNWISDIPIVRTSFEEFVTVIDPGDEKDCLMQLIRELLTWQPETRLTAEQLIYAKWLVKSSWDE